VMSTVVSDAAAPLTPSMGRRTAEAPSSADPLETDAVQADKARHTTRRPAARRSLIGATLVSERERMAAAESGAQRDEKLPAAFLNLALDLHGGFETGDPVDQPVGRFRGVRSGRTAGHDFPATLVGQALDAGDDR